jgi:hypothetical protein
MRIGTVFELMIDGPNPQFALQRSEYALDLRQLHIAGPQHRRVFAGEIAAQQIVSIALFGSLELRFIGAKRECRARDFLVLFRKPDVYEAESAPCLFLGRTDTQQQLIAPGQILPHGAQSAQKPSQPFAPDRILFGLPSAAFRQNVEFAFMLVQLHLD